LVFVVDASDRERLGLAKEEYERVTAHECVTKEEFRLAPPNHQVLVFLQLIVG
jgi:hypothetical protein